MKSYCDKIMSQAKRKKHTDPKFKGDPTMNLYKVLKLTSKAAARRTSRPTQ